MVPPPIVTRAETTHLSIQENKARSEAMVFKTTKAENYSPNSTYHQKHL